MKLSVIIPMYNEQAVIGSTCSALAVFLDGLMPGDYEIVIVDDGSADGSAEIVKEISEKIPALRLVSYKPNRGKGHAVRTGMLEARGDIRLFTDSDLAYGTEVIPVFIKEFDDPTVAVAVGTRQSKGGYGEYSFLRKIASAVFLRLLRFFGRLPVSDSQCGCKAFRADAAKTVFSSCETNGYAFDFEAILRAEKAGYAIKEVPVVIIHHGQSKVRLIRDSFSMLRDVRRIRKKVYGK